jgi:hypothetical protein
MTERIARTGRVGKQWPTPAWLITFADLCPFDFLRSAVLMSSLNARFRNTFKTSTKAAALGFKEEDLAVMHPYHWFARSLKFRRPGPVDGGGLWINGCRNRSRIAT